MTNYVNQTGTTGTNWKS